MGVQVFCDVYGQFQRLALLWRAMELRNPPAWEWKQLACLFGDIYGFIYMDFRSTEEIPESTPVMGGRGPPCKSQLMGFILCSVSWEDLDTFQVQIPTNTFVDFFPLKWFTSCIFLFWGCSFLWASPHISSPYVFKPLLIVMIIKAIILVCQLWKMLIFDSPYANTKAQNSTAIILISSWILGKNINRALK